LTGFIPKEIGSIAYLLELSKDFIQGFAFKPIERIDTKRIGKSHQFRDFVSPI
jgi:hypothetical protein